MLCPKIKWSHVMTNDDVDVITMMVKCQFLCYVIIYKWEGCKKLWANFSSSYTHICVIYSYTSLLNILHILRYMSYSHILHYFIIFIYFIYSYICHILIYFSTSYTWYTHIYVIYSFTSLLHIHHILIYVIVMYSYTHIYHMPTICHIFFFFFLIIWLTALPGWPTWTCSP